MARAGRAEGTRGGISISISSRSRSRSSNSSIAAMATAGTAAAAAWLTSLRLPCTSREAQMKTPRRGTRAILLRWDAKD